MSYIAYYSIRSDGDGDLCAIIADGDEIDEKLADDLRIYVEGRMNVNEGKDGWFKESASDPAEFPQVWDSQINAHRRQEGYCNDCAGTCQYDDQGKWIGDTSEDKAREDDYLTGREDDLGDK